MFLCSALAAAAVVLGIVTLDCVMNNSVFFFKLCAPRFAAQPKLTVVFLGSVGVEDVTIAVHFLDELQGAVRLRNEFAAAIVFYFII